MKIKASEDSVQKSILVDALRGISILLVMLFHFDMYYHLRTCLMAKSLGLSHIVTLITRNGYFGVTMFFVISGFLITSTSIRRYGCLRTINPLNFYWLRFARMTRCLALLLAILVALHCSSNPYFTLDTKDYSVFAAIFHILVFRFNALLVHFAWNINQWNILWSLSIEETFYICFPLLWIVIRDVRFIAGLCVVIFLAGPFARSHASPMGQIYGYFSCFDQIALGCLTAICFPLTRHWFKSSPFAILVPLGIALLLIGSDCALPPFLHFLRDGVPLLASFGRKSYEIYLFHLVLIQLMWIISADLKFNLKVCSPLWLLVFLCAAYAVAHLIFTFWSEPMNRSIRNMLKRFTTPQKAAGGELAARGIASKGDSILPPTPTRRLSVSLRPQDLSPR